MASRAARAHLDRASDNYSTETAVDASANGQGTVANQFIIDGLNVTSGIRQGVLNLTPNPDAIQETSIQVNTFSSEYGGGSSIQMASTTKSGSEQFHGLASIYYNNENLFANTVFMGPDAEYNPFHCNNVSFTVGGPIVPRKQFFFFFSAAPLRSSASTGNQTIFFPDQQFATGPRITTRHVRHQHPEHVPAEPRRPSVASLRPRATSFQAPAAHRPRTTCPATSR